jgi:hypothetical protein
VSLCGLPLKNLEPEIEIFWEGDVGWVVELGLGGEGTGNWERGP